ncbi:MAG: cellulase family glycosylhydrolase [Pirellulaceae bacterium]|nr:cellulase family glycosylhydrolase [Pirellulaceae bacterium]
MMREIFVVLSIGFTLVSFANPTAAQSSLPLIQVSQDKTHFEDSTGKVFRVWGVNYDHDDAGLLIEDYWDSDWPRVEEDFAEIVALGANVVRVHLQVAKFMSTADTPNQASLKKLAELVKLAERLHIYLDITGLGCYHKADLPSWYDPLDEAARWQVQAKFWRAIADTCKASPAIFCYDLMNEPILPGDKPETEWLTGELGGKHFVQRLTLDLKGRTREQVAAAWVKMMSDAIREVDSKHLITVGVIPWAHVFPGAKPIFYAPSVSGPLDFVSVHFYPKSGEVQKALDALNVYKVGKPIVVEEFFPLSCSLEEAAEFIEKSNTNGFVSFYWGKTIEQNEQAGDIRGAIIAKWLKYFRDHAAAAKAE